MTDHSAPTRGEVTQGDKAAAARWFAAQAFGSTVGDIVAKWQALEEDPEGYCHPMWIIMRDHRLAAIEECAKACDHIATVADGAENIGAQAGAMLAAKAIRNLGRGA